MNRTLTESRHVMSLMDKMKGQFADKNRANHNVKEELSKSVLKEETPLEQERQAHKQSKRRYEAEEPFNLTNSKEIDLFIYMAEDNRIPDYEFYYMIKE